MLSIPLSYWENDKKKIIIKHTNDSIKFILSNNHINDFISKHASYNTWFNVRLQRQRRLIDKTKQKRLSTKNFICRLS